MVISIQMRKWLTNNDRCLEDFSGDFADGHVKGLDDAGEDCSDFINEVIGDHQAKGSATIEIREERSRRSGTYVKSTAPLTAEVVSLMALMTASRAFSTSASAETLVISTTDAS